MHVEVKSGATCVSGGVYRCQGSSTVFSDLWL